MELERRSSSSSTMTHPFWVPGWTTLGGWVLVLAQQFLNFLPLPQGQGALRSSFRWFFAMGRIVLGAYANGSQQGIITVDFWPE